jgi:hypothetical protein
VRSTWPSSDCYSPKTAAGGTASPVPRVWVRDPTLVETRVAGAPARAYLVPEDDLVLVRFGRDSGGQYWPELLDDLARRLDQATKGSGGNDEG